jgi:pyruvate/2-oxoglutarate dehydrogenase complex dihydrolipoamide acyltransferase (E2) component
MEIPIVVPQLGEGLREVLVLRIFKDEGTRVERDEPLAEVETEKATVAIESPVTGIVGRWHVFKGQTAEVGTTMTSILSEHQAGDAMHLPAE